MRKSNSTLHLNLYSEDFPETEQSEGKLGERIAAGIVFFYTSSALLISIWSALIIWSGKLMSGGPIGIFVQLLKTTGLI